MPDPTAQSPARTSNPFASCKGDHVGLRVPNAADAIAWYTATLGFRVGQRMSYGELEFIFIAPPDDDNFRIELLAGPGAANRPSYADLGESLNLSGWHHLCISVASTDDAVAELKRLNVTVLTGPTDVPDINRRIAFFADPWGNLFELFQVIEA